MKMLLKQLFPDSHVEQFSIKQEWKRAFFSLLEKSLNEKSSLKVMLSSQFNQHTCTHLQKWQKFTIFRATGRKGISRKRNTSYPTFKKNVDNSIAAMVVIQVWKKNFFSVKRKFSTQANFRSWMSRLKRRRRRTWGFERDVNLMCERAEGKKKAREATESLKALWDAVLSRGILFPVAVIISHPHNLLLTLEKLFSDHM